MNRVEATRELRRRTEASVNEKVTHVALPVEVAQALLSVLAPEGEVSVGDRVSIPDDKDGTETGVVVALAPGGFRVRPETGEFADSFSGLWYGTAEVSLLDGEG